eukprot:2663543-Rhodomonas_salina.2
MLALEELHSRSVLNGGIILRVADSWASTGGRGVAGSGASTDVEVWGYRSIVHRDLKPENILVDAQGHLVVTGESNVARSGDNVGQRQITCCAA